MTINHLMTPLIYLMTPSQVTTTTITYICIYLYTWWFGIDFECGQFNSILACMNINPEKLKEKKNNRITPLCFCLGKHQGS